VVRYQENDAEEPRPVRRVASVVQLRAMEPPPALDLDLAAWLECYLADCEARGISPRTLEWYRDRGQRIVGMFASMGVHKPSVVSRLAVSRLMAHVRSLERRGKPLEPQTVHGYWQVGKGFLTFLIAEGARERSNPFDEFGKPKVPEKAMWAPSADECLAMLKVPDRKTVRGLRDIVLLYLFVDTGMRLSAIRSVKVSNIDLANRKIRVVEKGGKERLLPFGVQTMRWLRRYLASSRLPLEEYLFPGYNRKPLSRKRIDEIIKRCASKAGVRSGKVSPHDFRRAFAREFLRNGGDLESLRQLLGHSSYAMVKRYAQLADDLVAEKHRKASPGDRLRL
jgi:site-specific recombinase XerD